MGLSHWLRHPRSHGRDAVLGVTRADMFPPQHGAAVKVDQVSRGLSRQLSGGVYLVTNEAHRYAVYRRGELSFLRYPAWLRLSVPPKRVLYRLLHWMGAPQSSWLLYFPRYDYGMRLRALYVAWRHGARRYLADFPAYAYPAVLVRRLLGGALVLSEHNVEYARLAESTSDMGEAAYRRLKDLELEMCRRAQAVVAVSQRDLEQLRQDGIDRQRLHLIGHGVDLPAFERAQPVDLQQTYGFLPGTPVLVYHGIYSYGPNLEAIQVLADEVLPRLHAAGVRPKVLAVGPMPPEKELHEDIVFTGTVEQVAPYLKAADLAVVPLQQGGGTRMKLLDYFAAGVPVVSTRKGAEGLPLEDGQEILLRDEPDAFSKAVLDVLRQDGLADSLRMRAGEFAAGLDWSHIAEGYRRLFESLEK